MKKRPILAGLLVLVFLAGLFFVLTYASTLFREGGGRFGGDKIAIIKIQGVILDSAGTIEELLYYNRNESVKAIILRIDSPGGGVVPSQEIYEEVKKIRDAGEKKIVVSMGTMAASGGYYIASASDQIVANPGTLTGSIGVIMELVNVEGLMEKIGVESLIIKSGKNKDVGSPFRKMEPAERAILQRLMDDVHNQFIEAVAEGRGLSPEQVREMADGSVFTGLQARDLGLVDEIGNLQDTISLAAEMAGIEGEPQVIESRERVSIMGFFENRFPGVGRVIRGRQAGVSLQYLMAF